MSRHRDYQPTIDRAKSQAEIARTREARTREKADDHHRAMLRAQVAARIAGEEADALRDRIFGLERGIRELKSDARELRAERDQAGQDWALAVKDVVTLRAELAAAQRQTVREWLRSARDWYLARWNLS